ncbi:MAG TPA: tyrosine--tRNA ligase, partial [Actinomycetota bacterium]|nr:tyrosine--tRNA ligase [Actinomycetota bacterium]
SCAAPAEHSWPTAHPACLGSSGSTPTAGAANICGAMDLLADLDARGLVQDTTDRDALAQRLEQGPITLYYGCDPTADSLHVGNLIGLLVLRRFQDAGHRPVALAGGATGMVGDPSGRSDERNLLDEQTLAANVAAISAQMAAVIDFGEGGALLVDNRDWTARLGLLEFLRDVGKHATVNQMVAREAVRARMDSDQGISFTEFAYSLLQANDFRWLHDHLDCELQVGGSDQWGNILAGVDLIRRTRGSSVHGLSWPLLTAPDGTKLGKTTGARVWLDPAKTSPYRFFQHWMGVDDRQVGEFLAKFTLMPLEAVREAAAAHDEAPERREGQRRLAREVTALVHGAAAAAAAEAASAVLFGSPLDGVDADTLDVLASEVPTSEVDRARLDAGVDLVELLAEAGVAASRSEARRLLDQGGVSVNNVRVGAGATVGADDLLHGRFVLLRRGKDRHHLVVSPG